MEEDLGLIGASAEDTEAELIRKICETELLAGNILLFSLYIDFQLKPTPHKTVMYEIYLLSTLLFSYLFRREPAVCIPSPAGESLQLPRTLFPPTAHHCCLPGTLSVHDDKVNTI